MLEPELPVLKARRIALMAKHNKMTRELLLLDVQIKQLSKRKGIRQ
jgi:hypothetical protein